MISRISHSWLLVREGRSWWRRIRSAPCFQIKITVCAPSSLSAERVWQELNDLRGPRSRCTIFRLSRDGELMLHGATTGWIELNKACCIRDVELNYAVAWCSRAGTIRVLTQNQSR